MSQEVCAVPIGVQNWNAHLDLIYGHDGSRTVPLHRKHSGPIRIQKCLWPEEKTGICHTLMVHPPAGMAGGDSLQISVGVNTGAHVMLTTPGSGKWYGSDERYAKQLIDLKVDGNGILEWLPQDMILFNHAHASSQLEIALSREASFIGWDMLTLGRQSRGEQFEQGHYSNRVEIMREGKPIMLDSLLLAGGDRWLQSPLGLHGHKVLGTLWAIPPAGKFCADTLDEQIGRLREMLVQLHLPVAISRLDEVIVARYVGHQTTQCLDALAAVRARLRRDWFDLAEGYPRIWRT
jgi:urease accessory protein